MEFQVNKPYLSLITPFNGSPSFAHFLKSLKAQSLDSNLYEVIIVQESGFTAEAICLEILESKNVKVIDYKLPVQYNKHSAGRLRNAGAANARGEILVFIDSDCILSTDCLLKHYEFHRTNSKGVLCGSTSELAFHFQTNKILSKFYKDHSSITELLSKDYRSKFESENHSTSWLELYTSNASFSLKSFNQVRGFDESGFRCHDIDISYRLFKLGCNFKYDSSCFVIHLEHPRSIRYRLDQVDGWKLIGKKHPEISDLVNYKVKLFSNAYEKTSIHCKKLFNKISQYFDQPIVLEDIIIISNNKNNINNLNKLLSKLSHVLKDDDEFSSTYKIRLHRDCWDYQIKLLKEPQKDPFFSVVIPYNGQSHELFNCIKSVLRQTFQSFEIIIVNDNSKNVNFSQLLPLLRSNKVKIVNNQKQYGQSSSMNIGLLNSEGEYVFQLDSDDWISENALEETKKSLIKNNALALYGTPFITKINSIKIGEEFQMKSATDFLSSTSVLAPRVYKKSLLEKVGGWSTSDGYMGYFYEDKLMLKRIAEITNPVLLQDPVYYVTQNKQSLSRRNPLTTASAKLPILINEANREKQILSYKVKNDILHGKYKKRTNKNVLKRWSIIIPYRRSLSHLQIVLTSWCEAIEYSKLRNSEILIVDDSVTQEVNCINEVYPNISILKTEGNKGPSFSRNIGAKYAKGEFIFFGDEDHIVPKDILQFHSIIHNKNPNAIVTSCAFGRRVLFDLPNKISSRNKESILRNYWLRPEFETISGAFAFQQNLQVTYSTDNVYEKCFEHSYTESWQKDWGEIFIKNGFNLKSYPHSWLKCSSANLSMQKETLEQVGLFNESLRSMEDWDLGIRALKESKQIIVEPHTEPFHILHERDITRPHYDHEAINHLKKEYPDFILRLRNSTRNHILHSKFSNQDKKVDDNNSSSEKNIIAITFDDGPHEYYTNCLIDWLDNLSIKSTFFVLGSQAERYPQIIHRMNNHGHEIGIHNWIHYPFSANNDKEFLSGIERTRILVEGLISKNVRLVRPTYGIISKKMERKLFEKGYNLVGWNCSSKDWSLGITDKQIITNLAIEGVQNKILLFHDGVGEPENLKKVLNWIHNLCLKNEVRLITVSDFLALNNLHNLTRGLSYVNE